MLSYTISDEQKKYFKDNGFLCLKKVFLKKELLKLKNAYQEIWMNHIENGLIKQNPKQPFTSLFPRIACDSNYHETIRSYMIKTRTIGLVEQLIDEHALGIQSVYYFKPPGGRGLSIHQDNYEIGASPGTVYTVWISIEKAELKNGCMFAYPGTHKKGFVTPEKIQNKEYASKIGIKAPSDIKPVNFLCDQGDMVILNGNVLHGSYKNYSKTKFRDSIVFQYTGEGCQKIALHHNKLIDREGHRVRRRLNLHPAGVELLGKYIDWNNSNYLSGTEY